MHEGATTTNVFIKTLPLGRFSAKIEEFHRSIRHMQFPAKHQLIISMPQGNTITTDVAFIVNGFNIIIIIIILST